MAISNGRQVVTQAKLVYLPVECTAFLYDLPLTKIMKSQVGRQDGSYMLSTFLSLKCTLNNRATKIC